MVIVRFQTGLVVKYKDGHTADHKNTHVCIYNANKDPIAIAPIGALIEMSSTKIEVEVLQLSLGTFI